MGFGRLSRQWVAVVAVIVVVWIVVVVGLDKPSWIYQYRVADDHTLAVGTMTGPGAWTRVTDVTESPSTVTITVRSFLLEIGSRSGAGFPVESLATLRDPIGVRTVFDGSSGLAVRRATCPPPAYFATDCR